MAKKVGLKSHLADPVTTINQEMYFICGEEKLVDLIKRDTDLDLESRAR